MRNMRFEGLMDHSWVIGQQINLISAGMMPALAPRQGQGWFCMEKGIQVTSSSYAIKGKWNLCMKSDENKGDKWFRASLSAAEGSTMSPLAWHSAAGLQSISKTSPCAVAKAHEFEHRSDWNSAVSIRETSVLTHSCRRRFFFCLFWFVFLALVSSS